MYLENIERGRMKGPKCYAYIYPKALDIMPCPKIFSPDITSISCYSFDETCDIFFTGGAAGGYGITVADSYSNEFIMGLLNSKLIDWFMYKISMRSFTTAYQYIKKYLEKLPIRTIDKKPEEVALHDNIVSLVKLNA